MVKVRSIIYLLFFALSVFGQDSTSVKIVDKETKPGVVIQVREVVDTNKVSIDTNAVVFDRTYVGVYLVPSAFQLTL